MMDGVEAVSFGLEISRDFGELCVQVQFERWARIWPSDHFEKHGHGRPGFRGLLPTLVKGPFEELGEI